MYIRKFRGRSAEVRMFDGIADRQITRMSFKCNV